MTRVSSVPQLNPRGDRFSVPCAFFPAMSLRLERVNPKQILLIIAYRKYAEPLSFGLNVISVSKIESSGLFLRGAARTTELSWKRAVCVCVAPVVTDSSESAWKEGSSSKHSKSSSFFLE